MLSDVDIEVSEWDQDIQSIQKPISFSAKTHLELGFVPRPLAGCVPAPC